MIDRAIYVMRCAHHLSSNLKQARGPPPGVDANCFEDVTVSPVINVQPLITDLALVKTSLDNVSYKKGFTNMAQAFALAEVMYTCAGRKCAQSVIIMLTDGTLFFLFQTEGSL